MHKNRFGTTESFLNSIEEMFNGTLKLAKTFSLSSLKVAFYSRTMVKIISKFRQDQLYLENFNLAVRSVNFQRGFAS